MAGGGCPSAWSTSPGMQGAGSIARPLSCLRWPWVGVSHGPLRAMSPPQGGWAVSHAWETAVNHPQALAGLRVCGGGAGGVTRGAARGGGAAEVGDGGEAPASPLPPSTTTPHASVSAACGSAPWSPCLGEDLGVEEGGKNLCHPRLRGPSPFLLCRVVPWRCWCTGLCRQSALQGSGCLTPKPSDAP